MCIIRMRAVLPNIDTVSNTRESTNDEGIQKKQEHESRARSGKEQKKRQRTPDINGVSTYT